MTEQVFIVEFNPEEWLLSQRFELIPESSDREDQLFGFQERKNKKLQFCWQVTQVALSFYLHSLDLHRLFDHLGVLVVFVRELEEVWIDVFILTVEFTDAAEGFFLIRVSGAGLSHSIHPVPT